MRKWQYTLLIFIVISLVRSASRAQEITWKWQNTLPCSSPFSEFLNRVNNTPDPATKEAVVDSFLAAVGTFPFTEEDSLAHFVYRGSGFGKIVIASDWNGWDPNSMDVLINLDGTDFYYLTKTFYPDARLDYKFVKDGSNWLVDPLNPITTLGGYGANSTLVMPKYVPAPEIEYYPGIAHGSIETFTFHSDTMDNNRLVRVYLPPNYHNNQQRYPVFYLQDGGDYFNFAKIENTVDYLIDEGSIRETILVLVKPVNRDSEYQGDKRFLYEAMFVNELVPFIDSNYRTVANRQFRAIMGPSWGGNISVFIAYHHPEIFAKCASQSGAFWPNNHEVIREIRDGEIKVIQFYLDWGSYEGGLANDNKWLRDILITKYSLHWAEFHEGHSWGNWRAHIDDVMKLFYPPGLPVSDSSKTRSAPITYALYPNFPNPFNPITHIQFDLPQKEQVELIIFNLMGQQVRRLISSEIYPAGHHQLFWDGRDDRGILVGNGLYLCRFRAAKFVAVQKMILVQ